MSPIQLSSTASIAVSEKYPPLRLSENPVFSRFQATFLS